MAQGISVYMRFLSLIISLSVASLCAFTGFAQTTVTYYVQLTDKKGIGFSVERPREFLSPKAIERRRLQSIPITDEDLPVSRSYLQHISSIRTMLYPLKWTNGVVIKSDDPAIVSKLKGYPIVFGRQSDQQRRAIYPR
jgi:hypothetical protein